MAATAIAANAMVRKHPSLAILCLENSHMEGGFYILGELGVYRQICLFVTRFMSDKNVGISRKWRSVEVGLGA
jgi:hypothetical protein